MKRALHVHLHTSPGEYVPPISALCYQTEQHLSVAKIYVVLDLLIEEEERWMPRSMTRLTFRIAGAMPSFRSSTCQP